MRLQTSIATRQQFQASYPHMLSVVEFGRDTCGVLQSAEHREWLVTNGMGGYASGTIAGMLTRSYHGLLVVALKPPLGRTLLVSKFDEIAEYDGQIFPLGTNRWADGTVDPQGYRYIERFRLEGTIPVWTYAISDGLLEKRIWMQQGSNTTYVQYILKRGNPPLELNVNALVNYRDFGSTTHAGDWHMDVQTRDQGLCVVAFEGATPIYLRSANGNAEPAHEWYRNFDLAVERSRGLDDHEDHLHCGTFHFSLEPGKAVSIVLSTEADARLDAPAALQERVAQERDLLDRWARGSSAAADNAPGWVQQLVLAADQFVVKRPVEGEPEAHSVIAGYHWFGDWGRDTMIALPGLSLSTGRPEVARSILRTFARFVSQGMLPNRFPEAGEAPEYNTVDATLWYFEALRQHCAATQDESLLQELFPVLTDILDWHIRGTRHGVHVDQKDGLLFGGEAGVQLTWMDAKVDDWVVTPRIGKPVEINALWYNALLTTAEFAASLKEPTGEYRLLAERVRNSFQRFWNPATGYCFDVIDGPEGNDASLRPNQLFSVSLPHSPLDEEQQRAIVDVCARHLLTSHGLRSLAPDDAHYKARYGGSRYDRDAAYHQGTVWGWLIGPFVMAYLRVYGDSPQAGSFLEPFAYQLNDHGLGTLSEIFDGDAPFTPRGCIAQAWTVGEVLRAWAALEEAGTRKAPARPEKPQAESTSGRSRGNQKTEGPEEASGAPLARGGLKRPRRP